ncbi:Ger(x)C family spore germination protein [Sporosarcina oncorhynchi]|uniref:Ger(X)C family spore germination protein n=1 Tax=Sporosarcina oncorhynchi TaxID=3056444 RepID=A0ABZ0L458_9BACL|nr:Ger(x)C family spore germination protein [Sporosarcina sp. T2O-4]WOV86698.1 Ger(x)C family spore germination protein [Sporosarcina sp. T2O-4]
MKSFAIALVLLLSIILQTGCSFKDIDKRLFIAAIAIDPAESGAGYKVTLKLALPIASVKNSSGPRYAYLETEGDSIGESLRKLESHADKVLEYGHVKAIIINEKLFSEDVQMFMDYFTRRGDIQLIAYVIAAKPSAAEIIKVEPETEAASTITLFNFFDDSATESPYITTSFLFQFRRDYLGKGICAFIPLMETNDEGTELIVQKAIATGEGSDSLTLSDNQTKYYNSLFNRKSGLDYLVETDDLKLMLNIKQVKMSYQIITEGNEPKSIKVHVDFAGIIGQSSKVLHIEKLDKYNTASEKVLKENLTDFFKTLQEANIDPGFGLRYRATRLNQEGLIEKWEAAYKDLPIDISVKVRLKSTGAVE